MSTKINKVYLQADEHTSDALLNGTAVGDGTDDPIVGDYNSGTPLLRGLLAGVRGVLSSAGGNVIVVMYSDAGKTKEILRTTLQFTTSPVDSDIDWPSAQPFFAGLFMVAIGDATSAGKTIVLTPIIEETGRER